MTKIRARPSAELIIEVSRDLQNLAAMIDQRIKEVTGQSGVCFSLFVWTDGRFQYVSNCDSRAEIKRAILALLDGWDEGMPDMPAHEIQ